MTEDLHSPTTAGPQPTPVVGASDASFEQPPGTAAGSGLPGPLANLPVEEHPEILVGAAFAGGWAFGNLFGLGDYGTYILQVLFFVLGIVVMGAFIRAGMRIEPFTTRR